MFCLSKVEINLFQIQICWWCRFANSWIRWKNSPEGYVFWSKNQWKDSEPPRYIFCGYPLSFKQWRKRNDAVVYILWLWFVGVLDGDVRWRTVWILQHIYYLEARMSLESQRLQIQLLAVEADCVIAGCRDDAAESVKQNIIDVDTRSGWALVSCGKMIKQCSAMRSCAVISIFQAIRLYTTIAMYSSHAMFFLYSVANSPLTFRWMCDSPRTGCVRRTTPIYMWHEQAIIEWSWHVISIVACCHGAKLCALAARDFRSQQHQPAFTEVFYSYIELRFRPEQLCFCKTMFH